MLQVRFELLHGCMKISQPGIPLLKRVSQGILEQLPSSIERLSLINERKRQD